MKHSKLGDMLNRLRRIDPLLILIILAVAVAIVAPARGSFADGFSTAVTIAIALLFYLYGARLSTSEAISGLKNWKLHATILCFTFVLYPLVGLALAPLQSLVGHELYLGILYLTLVPSTVQSSVAFTSIARGNVAGAIVSASLSNLLGVFITPVLVLLLMGQGSASQGFDPSIFGNIALQLLVPFILGQLTRKWTGKLASNKLTKVVDRGSIAMVVYSAFSAGIVAGIWATVAIWQIVFLILLSIIIVSFMLFLSRKVGTLLKFSRGDVIAIEFCGSKKSLASGLPMAAIIFGDADLGLLILPLMIFHQVQLMICTWLAARYASEGDVSRETTN